MLLHEVAVVRKESDVVWSVRHWATRVNSLSLVLERRTIR